LIVDRIQTQEIRSREILLSNCGSIRGSCSSSFLYIGYLSWIFCCRIFSYLSL